MHDQQVALISHLPAIIARSYLDFVNSVDPNSLTIAGPGFESFTLIAHKDNAWLEEVKARNCDAIKEFLNEWINYLTHENKDKI